MKTATYNLVNGDKRTVEYDESTPCRVCGLPVESASMGGVDLCPWCDCGMYRDGEKWSFADASSEKLVRMKAEAKHMHEAVEASERELAPKLNAWLNERAEVAQLKAFRAHLDTCKQCREHPFNLCTFGMALLQVAGETAADALGEHDE
jgi:hypothetical protein